MSDSISRRLFLGSLATSTAAVPLLPALVQDLDLEVDRALELQEGDVLVVYLNELDPSPEQLAHTTEFLEEKVWPNVLLIPKGVEFEVIRRSPTVSMAFYEKQPRAPGSR